MPSLSLFPCILPSKTHTHTLTSLPKYTGTGSIGTISSGPHCPQGALVAAFEQGQVCSSPWGFPGGLESTGSTGGRVVGVGPSGLLRSCGCPCLPSPQSRSRSCAREAGALLSQQRDALRRCPNTAQRLGASTEAYRAHPWPRAMPRPRPSMGPGFVLEFGFSFPRGLPGYSGAPRDIKTSYSAALLGRRKGEGTVFSPDWLCPSPWDPAPSPQPRSTTRQLPQEPSVNKLVAPDHWIFTLLLIPRPIFQIHLVGKE